MRLRRVHPAPGEQHLHRHVIGHALRQLDARRVGERPRPDFRQRESGVLRGVDEVAGQRQLEAAADRHAVDGSDHRLVHVEEFLQSAEAADAVVAVDRIARGRRLQVPPGGKEPAALAPDDRHPKVGVVAEPPERLAHQPRGREIDGIRLRPVERHLEYPVDRTGAHHVIHRHPP